MLPTLFTYAFCSYDVITQTWDRIYCHSAYISIPCDTFSYVYLNPTFIGTLMTVIKGGEWVFLLFVSTYFVDNDFWQLSQVKGFIIKWDFIYLLNTYLVEYGSHRFLESASEWEIKCSTNSLLVLNKFAQTSHFLKMRVHMSF